MSNRKWIFSFFTQSFSSSSSSLAHSLSSCVELLYISSQHICTITSNIHTNKRGRERHKICLKFFGIVYTQIMHDLLHERRFSIARSALGAGCVKILCKCMRELFKHNQKYTNLYICQQNLKLQHPKMAINGSRSNLDVPFERRLKREREIGIGRR